MTLNRGNKLFEGSRMVLPEHRKSIRDRSWEQDHLVEPPILDEQQLEELQYTIVTAIEEERKVEIFYHINRQRFSRIGVIEGMDVYAKMLKVKERDGSKALVSFQTIASVSMLD